MHFVKAAVFAAALFAATGGASMAQETHMNDTSDVLATIDTMTTAFAEGDVATIMSTYTPEAAVVAEPGKPVRGDEELRAMFAAFIDAGVAFVYGAHDVVVAGDTALHLMKWTAPTPDGGEADALSVAVLKRQDDGGWKMIIDHPFGDTVMKAQ